MVLRAGGRLGAGELRLLVRQDGRVGIPGPLKTIKERVSTNEAERRTLFQRRNVLVEHVAKNGTFRDLKDAAVSAVMKQSRGHSYSHRGRLISVRKYKQKTGNAPEPGQMTTAISRSGNRKDVVKVYDQEDSSSWSFSDKDTISVGWVRRRTSSRPERRRWGRAPQATMRRCPP